jgi:hypothetical protein
MKYAAVCAMVVVYGGLFALGCWEAFLANQHEPTLQSSPGFYQGYIFTTICAILNIMSSVLMTCLLLFRDTKKENNAATVSWTCLVAIWGIVLFAGMVNDKIYTGPFQIVVIVQFAITMAGMCLCCCSCISLTIINMCGSAPDSTPDSIVVQV